MVFTTLLHPQQLENANQISLPELQGWKKILSLLSYRNPKAKIRFPNISLLRWIIHRLKSATSWILIVLRLECRLPLPRIPLNNHSRLIHLHSISQPLLPHQQCKRSHIIRAKLWQRKRSHAQRLRVFLDGMTSVKTSRTLLTVGLKCLNQILT